MLSHSVRVKGPHKNVPRSLVKPKCRILAQRRSSAPAENRSAHRPITDLRARMSVHRRIPDAKPSGAEGRSLTQSVNREFLVWIGLALSAFPILVSKSDIAQGDHRLAGISPRPLCPERVLWRQNRPSRGDRRRSRLCHEEIALSRLHRLPQLLETGFVVVQR